MRVRGARAEPQRGARVQWGARVVCAELARCNNQWCAACVHGSVVCVRTVVVPLNVPQVGWGVWCRPRMNVVVLWGHRLRRQTERAVSTTAGTNRCKRAAANSRMRTVMNVVGAVRKCNEPEYVQVGKR